MIIHYLEDYAEYTVEDYYRFYRVLRGVEHADEETSSNWLQIDMDAGVVVCQLACCDTQDETIVKWDVESMDLAKKDGSFGPEISWITNDPAQVTCPDCCKSWTVIEARIEEEHGII